MPPIEIVAESAAIAAAQVVLGKTVAVIGYGNQGRSHALNLRESGIDIVVGGRAESLSLERANREGFQVADIPQSAAVAELVIVSLPDEAHEQVCPSIIAAMKPTSVLGFLHGFSIHFGAVCVPESIGVVLVAPKGPGTALRERFVEGLGIPSLLAVHQGGSDAAKTEALALGWAHGIGSGRAGIIRTTFRDEAETDLFGEQSVLCGGLSELIRAAYEILVEAGYPPLLAYTECCHEVKQVADLICDRGMAGMGRAISTTARFGAAEAGPRIIDATVRARMREVLRDIQDGSFAKRMRHDALNGSPVLKGAQASTDIHAMEAPGRVLRAMLPWLR
ncbi:MAG: ketol-acid reductoisomerase [Phycisphaerales bacterium]|nr:ketol-acid reductoisomerase [Phycisphaerales bacterium]